MKRNKNEWKTFKIDSPTRIKSPTITNDQSGFLKSHADKRKSILNADPLRFMDIQMKRRETFYAYKRKNNFFLNRIAKTLEEEEEIKKIIEA